MKSCIGSLRLRVSKLIGTVAAGVGTDIVGKVGEEDVGDSSFRTVFTNGVVPEFSKARGNDLSEWSASVVDAIFEIDIDLGEHGVLDGEVVDHRIADAKVSVERDDIECGIRVKYTCSLAGKDSGITIFEDDSGRVAVDDAIGTESCSVDLAERARAGYVLAGGGGHGSELDGPAEEIHPAVGDAFGIDDA